MDVEFQKATFRKTQKNWPVSNHSCVSRLLQCIPMKLGIFVQWSFLVIRNKSDRKDLLEQFWIYCNPKFQKWKNAKSSLVSLSRQEKLQFPLYIPKFYNCTKFHYHQVARKRFINNENFQSFCF